MVFVANFGFSNIPIEGDSLQVVNAPVQKGKFFLDCWSILFDCNELLPLFSSCTFVHVNRSCNRVAHSLAKQALLGNSCSYFGGGGGHVPQWLLNLCSDYVRSLDRDLH